MSIRQLVGFVCTPIVAAFEAADAALTLCGKEKDHLDVIQKLTKDRKPSEIPSEFTAAKINEMIKSMDLDPNRFVLYVKNFKVLNVNIRYSTGAIDIAAIEISPQANKKIQKYLWEIKYCLARYKFEILSKNSVKQYLYVSLGRLSTYVATFGIALFNTQFPLGYIAAHALACSTAKISQAIIPLFFSHQWVFATDRLAVQSAADAKAGIEFFKLKKQTRKEHWYQFERPSWDARIERLQQLKDFYESKK